jgi:hypothetical protein
MTGPGPDAEMLRLSGLAAQLMLAFLDDDQRLWTDLVNRNPADTIEALAALAAYEAALAHGDDQAARAHFAELAVIADIEQIQPTEGDTP